MTKPEPGWVVHYFTLFGEPVDWWGRVVEDAYDGDKSVTVDVFGYQGRPRSATTTLISPHDPGHCEFFKDPPDEFYVWQAKMSLLGEITND